MFFKKSPVKTDAPKGHHLPPAHFAHCRCCPQPLHPSGRGGGGRCENGKPPAQICLPPIQLFFPPPMISGTWWLRVDRGNLGVVSWQQWSGCTELCWTHFPFLTILFHIMWPTIILFKGAFCRTDMFHHREKYMWSLTANNNFMAHNHLKDTSCIISPSIFCIFCISFQPVEKSPVWRYSLPNTL